MKIAVTGASGFLGVSLCARLAADGHELFTLVRDRARAQGNAVYWDPSRGEIDAASLEGVDAVVHLAGENIGEGRWTEERKKKILQSRVDGTRLIASTMAKLTKKPSVLVSASALGAYGNRGGEWLDESSARGTGFLAEVVEAWESSADDAREAGIRVVHPRTGIVLALEGGALAKMITPFKLGVGGRLGDGKQFMSWITHEDTIAALAFVLSNESLSGPVNVVAPNPVTNAEFSETLARVLHRPAFLPAPRFALKLALGEMAQELLLDSARLVPKKLRDAGFVWKHVELEEALRSLIKNA